MDTRVRTVLAGYKGNLATHITKVLGDRTLDDPAVRSIITRYMTWYDTRPAGQCVPGTSDYLTGQAIWSDVDNMVEDTIMNKNEVTKQLERGLREAMEQYEDTSTQITPAEPVEAGTDVNKVNLRTLIESQTYGRGHDLVMTALSVSTHPDTDVVLQALCRKYWTMWKSNSDRSSWGPFYREAERYIVNHGGTVPPRDSNSKGSGARPPESPSEASVEAGGVLPYQTPSKNASQGILRRKLADAGTATLRGTVKAINATASTLVGEVVPGIIAATVSSSTKGIVGIEDAVYGSRVEYSEAKLARIKGNKLGKLKDRVRKEKEKARPKQDVTMERVAKAILAEAAKVEIPQGDV